MATESGKHGPTPFQIARHALEQLRWPPDLLEQVDVLESGIGAGAFALHFADGKEAILKAKLPSDGADACQNALREAYFYRHLAGCLPLRTPRILGVSADPRTGAFVVMAKYRPSPAPASWRDPDVFRAARELGRFHAAFWGRAASLASCTFLRRRSPEPTEGELDAGRSAWANLRDDSRFADVLTPVRMRHIEGWIESVPSTTDYITALPETLVHGDCHLGNILLDSTGNLVWSDWAGAGIGRGPEDLSFLYQRAEVAGRSIRLQGLVAAYHDGLQPYLSEDVEVEEIQRAVEASEWSVRLLQWPHYLDYSTPEDLEKFLARLDCLAADLFFQ